MIYLTNRENMLIMTFEQDKLVIMDNLNILDEINENKNRFKKLKQVWSITDFFMETANQIYIEIMCQPKISMNKCYKLNLCHSVNKLKPMVIIHVGLHHRLYFFGVIVCL